MGVRIILAEDHKIVREGLKALLQKEDDFEVIAEAGDGATVLTLVGEMSPDIIIMDVVMPDLNGIEVTRRVIAKSPSTRIIALSMYANRRIVAAMLTAGASGYLIKDCAVEELVQAVRIVSAGKTYLSPDVAGASAMNCTRYLENNRFSMAPLLTSRQRQVLQFYAEGKSMKEIANKLRLSIKTVETYRQQIIDKLGLTSTVELIKYALREGLASVEK